MSVYEHFYRDHSASELKKWGINREILGQGLSEDLRLKSIAVEREDGQHCALEGLKERNAFGLDPRTGMNQPVAQIPIRKIKSVKKTKNKQKRRKDGASESSSEQYQMDVGESEYLAM